jgi:Protein of unknown function (DUF3617)
MMKRSLTSLAAFTFCATAGGAEFPKRAAGLWEEKMTSGTGDVSHRICVDEKLTDFLKGPAVCSKQDVRAQANGYVIETVCKQGDSTTYGRTVLTGDPKQAYTAEAHLRYEPAFMGMKESKMVISARWLGPCPPGMRGGDAISSDGTKFNFHDLEKGAMPK